MSSGIKGAEYRAATSSPWATARLPPGKKQFWTSMISSALFPGKMAVEVSKDLSLGNVLVQQEQAN